MDRHSMKPFSSFVLLTVFIRQAIGFTEVVGIPDPNLRKALESTLQINADQGITKEALARLEMLNARKKNIADFVINER